MGDSTFPIQLVPVAATVGTQVVVENLFRNSSLNHALLRKKNEKKIINLVRKYALNSQGVSMKLRKVKS